MRHIPHECWQKIGSYMSVQDVCAISSVSRTHLGLLDTIMHGFVFDDQRGLRKPGWYACAMNMLRKKGYDGLPSLHMRTVLPGISPSLMFHHSMQCASTLHNTKIAYPDIDIPPKHECRFNAQLAVLGSFALYYATPSRHLTWKPNDINVYVKDHPYRNNMVLVLVEWLLTLRMMGLKGDNAVQILSVDRCNRGLAWLSWVGIPILNKHIRRMDIDTYTWVNILLLLMHVFVKQSRDRHTISFDMSPLGMPAKYIRFTMDPSLKKQSYPYMMSQFDINICRMGMVFGEHGVQWISNPCAELDAEKRLFVYERMKVDANAQRRIKLYASRGFAYKEWWE